jgi:two-component system, OmpR family, alkaline phosphatase synthesis response regulator PhoP
VLSLEFLVTQAGYEIRVSRDGAEALAAVREWRPDLVLLDIMLPLKDGFEVCQQIRDDPAIRDTKVIMITAKGREVEVAKGMAVGADAYVTKPFSTKELVALIRQMLGDDAAEA